MLRQIPAIVFACSLIPASYAAAPDPVAPDPNTPRPIATRDTVWIEEMTWMEVRDAMKAGKTTVLIPTGGVEQNGPYLATGKHNIILRATAERIARKLGDTLVAPIVGFVPEGDISPPTEHMKYPGSISLSEDTYRRLLTDICASFRTHGFKHIVLIGDSGGNQVGMKAVAAAMSAQGGDKTRVHFIPEYYDYPGVKKWLDEQGVTQTDEGIHDDFAITAQMMAVDPTTVRMQERIAAGKFRINGIDLAPAEKTIDWGRKIVDYRANQTVKAIRAARGDEQSVDLGGVSEEHVMIPMRDGVKLSAYLYFPPGDGPWPVLYEQRYADLRDAGTRRSMAGLAKVGYVVAAENFRGTHESEGTWVGYRALGWGQQQDGYDTVEWLASQPWSTGKIGTFGSSQAGFAQNFLAVAGPPHLVCQYMIDTGLSLFHEGYRIGGTTRPERFKQMDAVCREPGQNRRLVEEWFAHPNYDDYWAQEDCTRFIDKMNVPCFTIGSWYDFMCVGSLESYSGRQHRGGERSRGAQQLLVGPWLHGRFNKSNKTAELLYPENAAFLVEPHMLRWFDHYLKGQDNGAERDPTVRYYVMGAVGEESAPGNEWRTADDWPVPAKATPFYLHAGGKFSAEAPSEADSHTALRADPLHPNVILGRAFPGAADARGFEQQAEVRTFTTEPLAEPVEWTGKVRAELLVSSSAPDTDFIVRLSDVYPDGRSILIMDYIRRARYREGYEREVRMEPGQIYPVSFDIGSLSQIFNRGHRIRVTLASTGAPFYEPNPNTGETLTIEPAARTIVAENSVYHERAHSSRIIAPLR